MNDKLDLNEFRNKLEERLAAIDRLQENRKKDAGPVELDQARTGRLTRMDAMQQQAMSQAASRLTDLERQRVQDAIGRMDVGDYGCCLVCGEDIAEGRLRVDPSVPTCIDCARKAEKP